MANSKITIYMSDENNVNLDYIPDYKEYEKERQENEVKRQEYYEDFKNSVNNGEFNGKNLEFDWEDTKLGVRVEGQTTYEYIELKGADGKTPVKGADYWNEEDKEEVKDFIDEDVSDLETLLRDILTAIQNGGTTSSTIEEIEQLIVSYFETKTVEGVEA